MKQLLDMPPHCYDKVFDILHTHAAPFEVWAFGSRVKWSSRANSDLDIVLRNPNQLENKIDRAVLETLDDAFLESDIPFLVDILDWAAVSDSFRKIIEREKIVLHSGETAIAHD